MAGYRVPAAGPGRLWARGHTRVHWPSRDAVPDGAPDVHTDARAHVNTEAYRDRRAGAHGEAHVNAEAYIDFHADFQAHADT
jgi:hypothetical protein